MEVGSHSLPYPYSFSHSRGFPYLVLQLVIFSQQVSLLSLFSTQALLLFVCVGEQLFLVATMFTQSVMITYEEPVDDVVVDTPNVDIISLTWQSVFVMYCIFCNTVVSLPFLASNHDNC